MKNDNDNMIDAEIVDSSTLSALTKAEIDMQIATAKAYPRSLRGFRDDATEFACLDEETAGDCRYVLPRAGKKIEGPSARLAEIVASCWGNCKAGARVMSEERDFVVAQGVFFDLEKNVSITYEVKRRITDKHNKRLNTDMIAVTSNAACSIALRNAILKGVPKAAWKPVYDAAVRCSLGDEKTLTTRRADLLNWIRRCGITEDRVLKVLRVKGVEDIGLEELATLRGICTAIKEGDTTAEQAFSDPEVDQQSRSDINAALDRSTQQPATKGDAAADEEKPNVSDAGEQAADDSDAADLKAEIERDVLDRIKSIEVAADAAPIAEYLDQLSRDETLDATRLKVLRKMLAKAVAGSAKGGEA